MIAVNATIRILPIILPVGSFEDGNVPPTYGGLGRRSRLVPIAPPTGLAVILSHASTIT